MTAKVGVTVDTTTLARPSVELLLREHRIPYDLAGTEPTADEIEQSGGQSPSHLQLPPRVTDAERAFLGNFTPDWEKAGRYLYAHRRESRAVFVTDHVEAFGEPGSERRRRLTRLADTAILSFPEFRRWCSEQQTRR